MKSGQESNLVQITCVHLDALPILILLKMKEKNLTQKRENVFYQDNGNETKGYRLYDPIQSRVIHSRDVQFNESTRGIEKEKLENKEQRLIWLNDLSKP